LSSEKKPETRLVAWSSAGMVAVDDGPLAQVIVIMRCISLAGRRNKKKMRAT
jgi:hypothetical protein